MQVDGTLHLWTTLLGWHYYNVIWGLLASSGIAILPIAGIVLDHILDVRSRGSVMSSDGDSSLAPLEVQLFVAIMVVLLAVRPAAISALSPTTLTYTPQPTVYDDPTTPRTVNSTGTTMDGVLQSADYNIGAGNIPTPPLWFVVMQVSQGFRFALVNNIDNRGQVYRALRDIANRAAITDPGLKTVINDFHTECYTPALSKYRRDGVGTTLVEPTTTTAGLGDDQEGADIGWMGSKVFQTTYYPTIRTRHVVQGFPYDAAVDTEYAPGNIPTSGAPLCSEYWEKIRDEIYNKAVADGTVGIIDRSRVELAGVVTFAAAGSDRIKDEVARTYLANTEIALSKTAEQIFATRTQGDGALGGFARSAAGWLQSWELVKLAGAAEFMVDALINMLVYAQAFALMLLFMVTSIIIVLSRYSVGAVAGIAVTIFLLNFLPVVWAMIAWMDNSNGMALWNDEGYFGTILDGGPDALKARLTHSIAIALLYATSSVLFFALIALSGIRSAYAIGAIGRSIGTGAGVSPVGPVSSRSPALKAGREAVKDSRSAWNYAKSKVGK